MVRLRCVLTDTSMFVIQLTCWERAPCSLNYIIAIYLSSGQFYADLLF